MIPGIFFEYRIQRKGKDTIYYLFLILNCCLSSSSGGATHNACALALKDTCAHTLICKHAPHIDTIKPHS
jgi:hypothetical protein